MKKISNYELGSLVMVLTITINSGINKNILTSSSSLNAWFILIISYILGFIPLFITLYIANYCKDVGLKNKIKLLFNKTYYLFYIFLFIIYFIIGITILYNISLFINVQFLYKTPIFLCGLLLMLICIVNVNNGIHSVSRTSLILVFFNIIMFFISFMALINEFDINNLKPFFVTENNIIRTSFLSFVNISLPFLIILLIPKNKVFNLDNYNKTVIISYVLGGIISVIISFFTVGVLGNYLADIVLYPEYIVLKRVKIFGFIERVENIFGNQWIIGSFIYLSLILFFLSDLINGKKKVKFYNLIIGFIMFLICFLIFRNSTMFKSFISYRYHFIIMSLIPIYICLFIKTFINNKKKKKCKYM